MQRRPAAEAALESVVQLARWACGPLQGGEAMPPAAREHDAVSLLCKAASGEGSGNSGSSLVTAAVAAAGCQQVQRCALTLAAILAAAAAQQGSAMAVPKLAVLARLLRCTCDDFGPSGAVGGGSTNSGTGPLTVGCLRSRQGQQQIHTRVAVPAKVLDVTADWFAGDGNGLITRLQQVRHQQC